jgi:phosphoserine phosphatase
MKDDSPIVEEVRRRRMEISARFDHDLEKYAAHLKEVERQYADRVVNQVTVIRAPSAAGPVKP